MKSTAENDAPAHECEWEIEYLPDPMSTGAVVRTGDLVCGSCFATTRDIPPEVGGAS